MATVKFSKKDKEVAKKAQYHVDQQKKIDPLRQKAIQKTGSALRRIDSNYTAAITRCQKLVDIVHDLEEDLNDFAEYASDIEYCMQALKSLKNGDIETAEKILKNIE